MTTILFNACRPVNRVSRHFGAGVFQAAPRVVCKPATDAEYRDRVESLTMSAAEYRAMLAEIEAERRDRERNAEEAECSELGISAEAMGRLAEEARQMDRLSGQDFTPAVEVRVVEIRGTRYAAEPIAPGEDNLAAVRLEKLAGDGAVYDVARTRLGTVECTCGDYVFRLAGTAGRCKHGAALEAAGLLDPPAPARKPRRKVETMRTRRRDALKAARAAATVA